jgi:hypothetical protein
MTESSLRQKPGEFDYQKLPVARGPTRWRRLLQRQECLWLPRLLRKNLASRYDSDFIFALCCCALLWLDYFGVPLPGCESADNSSRQRIKRPFSGRRVGAFWFNQPA